MAAKDKTTESSQHQLISEINDVLKQHQKFRCLKVDIDSRMPDPVFYATVAIPVIIQDMSGVFTQISFDLVGKGFDVISMTLETEPNCRMVICLRRRSVQQLQRIRETDTAAIALQEIKRIRKHTEISSSSCCGGCFKWTIIIVAIWLSVVFALKTTGYALKDIGTKTD